MTDKKQTQETEIAKTTETVQTAVDLGIYTPLSVAKEEIWRRWNDKELRKKVEDFLGGDIPEVFLSEPRAILARHVASPNNETSWFLDMAEASGLKYVFLEYLQDKFTFRNLSKYYLGKLVFRDGVGKHAGDKLFVEKIVDFNQAESKKICDVLTLSEMNLVDFHHELLRGNGVNLDGAVFDMSEWYSKHGGVAKRYYEYYFALLICYGILFENYLSDKNEGSFVQEVITPAFKKVYGLFGVKPLVVSLVPKKSENDLVVYHYKSSLFKNLNFKESSIDFKRLKIYALLDKI